MPNWCQCDLDVTGDVNRVRAFLEFAKGEDGGTSVPLDFNRFIPYPSEWRELDDAFDRWLRGCDLAGPRPVHAYSKWGYAWCIRHWGTKWNPRHAVVLEREAACGMASVVRFDTAWSPPVPVVLRASQLFPDIHFELAYAEPLAGFSGVVRCHGGWVTLDEFWECLEACDE